MFGLRHVLITIKRPTNLIVARNFHISTTLNKKKPRGSNASKQKTKEDGNEEIVDAATYVRSAETEYAKSLQVFEKSIVDLRQQRAKGISVFDELIVKDGRKFKELATTTSKGGAALLITVFDAREVKDVISAILASGLNLTPIRIPDNEQQLKVALPPPTVESRKELVREWKTQYDKFRHSHDSRSLDSIRSVFQKSLKNLDNSDSDNVKRALKQLEKIHQEYAKGLQDIHKRLEKTLVDK